MPVPSTIADLSTTLASNSPAGSEAILPNLDGYLRAHGQFIAQNYAARHISVADYGALGGVDDTAAFNLAIAALPAEGGVITLGSGLDYTATVGPFTAAGAKVITWDARSATAPADLPGAVLKSGNFDVSHSPRGSAKPGDFYELVEYGDGLTSSLTQQIGAAYHVQGTYQNQADHAGQSFFHAYSFTLTSQDTLTMGELRGVKGTVIGDGGSSTMRGIHVTAVGDNGFVGALTGVMGTVEHIDKTDGAFVAYLDDPTNAVPTNAVAIRGQVGSAAKAAFNAESFPVAQIPKWAYLVERTGDAALLPEYACYEGHGSGNGSIFRGVRSTASADIIYDVDNKGRQMARSYYSGRVSLSQDTMTTITVSAGSSASGIIIVWGGDLNGLYGMACFRCTGTALMQSMNEGSIVDFSTGTLTGTTGAVGQVTVSAKTDGTIDIENRRVGASQVNWMLLHSAEALGNIA